MNAPLDTFDTALLARLREEVVQQPRPGHVVTWRRVLVAAAASAATAASIVVLPGLGSTPAYAVQEGNSGVITVDVLRLEDAEGLEAELAGHGISADVTYLPSRQECAPGRYAPVGRSLSGMGVSMGADLLRVTLPPGTVRDGETFVLAVSGGAVPPTSTGPSEDGITDLGGFSGWTDFDVTAGPVQACRVVSPATQ